jgi:prepilin-type N-terminal cleavage/methylation domain-containing protein
MKHSSGFTLIEVIVIMTIMAIAAAMFASSMGTSFTQSPASTGLVNRQYAMIQQMEIITSRYRQALPIADLCSFKTTYVDGQPFVDAANTSCTYTLTSGTFTTRSALLITLTDGNQKLQSIFTN